jgi:transcriptional regulator with XRE-family HTH domain
LSLGTYLKELREKKMVDRSATLQDVSVGAKVSISTLHQLEGGAIRNPGISTLSKLAEYYGVTVDSLITKLDD